MLKELLQRGLSILVLALALRAQVQHLRQVRRQGRLRQRELPGVGCGRGGGVGGGHGGERGEQGNRGEKGRTASGG